MRLIWFSQLRDLVSVNATTACSTHELINCSCISGLIDGIQPEAPTEDVDVQSEDSDIEDWDGPEGAPNHFMPASQYKPPKKKRIVSPNLRLVSDILHPAPRLNGSWHVLLATRQG